uniref:Uncharacterized protein n=1 Tax=Arundo donax TaxID=35708 RepID=A0A0A8Y4J6_ARUDO
MRQVEETKAVVAGEQARMNAIGNKVLQIVTKAGGEFWWETDVEALGNVQHVADERLKGKE